MTGLHGAEATMAKLVHKMPEVACRVLSNSVTSKGHPDSKEYVRSYDFSSLQDCSPGMLANVRRGSVLNFLENSPLNTLICEESLEIYVF